LASLDDITDKLVLEPTATAYDRSTSIFTLSARLRNASRDTVRGPAKARLVVLRSAIGVPHATGTENGLAGPGAIWDLTSAIPSAGLLPDSSGPVKTFSVHLADVRSVRAGKDFQNGLVHMEMRMYGSSSKSAVQAGERRP
jgi:hypothetical protein